MAVCGNTQESKRSRIKMQISFAKSCNGNTFHAFKNIMPTFRIEFIPIHRKSDSNSRHGYKLFATNQSKQQFIFFIPQDIGTFKRSIVKINRKRNQQRLEIIEMATSIRA